MTTKMGAKEVILIFHIVAILATQATEVNVSGEWKTDLGWEVTCGWQTLSNDTLQSVRLYHNGQQFMIYRPEKHGPSKTEVFRAPDHYINIDCAVTSERGQTGRCVLTLEPYQPPLDDSTYTCEVSGERPMFRIGKMDYLLKSLVVPSDAHLEIRASEDPASPRVTLNCSTEGLPAPTLNWIVGGDKIQADFNRREWNATSKLWHAWSSLSYTKTDPTQTVTCLPEITRNNDTIKGKPAVYNSATLISFDKIILLTAILNHLR
ncbi:uncharacterized protein LOC123714276 [Pieris brassicae]|uniref:uncharacterized protein LOC123714276 n=1 Tax=Pieris brassicae TaxID=7116 RepID=UPI001E65F377|nr:uncharacterized protein LOC123714276 [Pieris brassicae]